MKQLDNIDKLRIVENVIEPALKALDTGVVLGSMDMFLKAYVDSDYFINDEPDARVAMIHSMGIIMRMIDLLESNYED